MRKFWFVAGAVLVAAGVGGWAALSLLVDAERHGRLAAELLAHATGWECQVESASLTFASGVAIDLRGVALVDPSSSARLDADRAVVRAALPALFAGRLEATEVRLLRPSVVIARDAQGQIALPRLADGASLRGARGRLDEVHLQGARVTIAGRDGSARTLVLDELAAVLAPGTGRVWGNARVGSGEGRVRWLGRAGDPIDIDLERVPCAPIAQWLALPAPAAGEATGRVTWRPGDTIDIGVDLDGFALDAERPAWPRTTLRVVALPPASGERVLTLSARAGGVEVKGDGTLRGSALALALTATGVPTAELASIALPALGWPWALDGPGTADLTLRLVRADESAPATASFEVTALAQTMRGLPGIPALTPSRVVVAAPPGEPPRGRLEGVAEGGVFEADLTLDRRVDPQAITLEGAIRGASLAALLARGGGLPASKATIAIDGQATLALHDRGHTGTLALAIRGLPPAWGTLDTNDGDGAETASGPMTARATLVLLAGAPWRLRDVIVENARMSARGEGTFDSASGAIALELAVRARGGEPKERLVRLAGPALAPRAADLLAP